MAANDKPAPLAATSIVDTDPAMMIHAEKAPGTITAESEANPHLDRRLNRKFDFHILPWLFGIW